MQFTREQLVSFGNYLLSEERAKMASELNREFVTHADVENWMEENLHPTYNLNSGKIDIDKLPTVATVKKTTKGAIVLPNAAQVTDGFIWREPLPLNVISGGRNGYSVNQNVLCKYLMKFVAFIEKGQHNEN